MKKYFVTCLLVSSFIPKLYSDEVKGPHHQGTLSSLNLGIRYSSVLQNRGVVFYKDFQIDPVLGIFLFDDRLEFLGDSVGFRDFVVNDWLRLRTKLVSISDNPLFPSKESVKNDFPDRTDTYEWSNSAEFFIPGYNSNYSAEIDLTWAKDISQTHGHYLEAVSKVKLFDFTLPLANTKVEPNIFASIGWGDSSHNQYFYGQNADQSGLNNASYGLWFVLPDEADRFYPIVQIRHFQVLGKNRDGAFALDRSDGWLLSFIATAGVL